MHLLIRVILLISVSALSFVESGDNNQCSDYDGINHPSQKNVCCAAACGTKYCGSVHCDDGPGGGDACCASHITKNHKICGVDNQTAPCILGTPVGPGLYDDFTSRNISMWKYADKELFTQFAPVMYLLNHSEANAKLSLNEGYGLRITMSSQPCHDSPTTCKGAKMASDHLSTNTNNGYGDYEARFRAPYTVSGPGNGSTCDDGIYAYFTAGYRRDGSNWWNEMNFGFHPDRDDGGTKVSCELHADTGGYKEVTKTLGFNYREAFHTYLIRLRPTYVEWYVDGHLIHHVDDNVSHTMHTSLILRTNKKGEMPTAVMEWKYFKYTPYAGF